MAGMFHIHMTKMCVNYWSFKESLFSWRVFICFSLLLFKVTSILIEASIITKPEPCLNNIVNMHILEKNRNPTIANFSF